MNSAIMTMIVALVLSVSQFAVAQEGATSDLTQAKRDQLRIAVQAICPISGEKLGDHGQPVKVKVGEEIVFVCCRDCLSNQIDPQHWGTIHANFAKAQRICPVMKHELPKSPKWTIVEGQIVFVCCPPCTTKIAADPTAYLQQVDTLYEASLRALQTRR